MAQYSSRQIGYGRAFANALMEALATRPAAALVAAGFVRLSQAPGFNPTPASTRASLVTDECTFSGYPAGGVAAVLTDDLNLGTQAQGVLIPAVFEAAVGAPFVENRAYGYWVDDGTIVVAYERFPDSVVVTFAAPGDYLDLSVLLPFLLQQTAA